MKLLMLKGLPASGKSTWARERIRESGGMIKRINKDDLRDMVDDGKWSKANEKEILAVRDMLIEHYLSRGLSVIVDDTNLAPKHEATLKELAKRFNAKFEVQSFLDVPLTECIRRDLARPKSVGERVINSMYKSFLHTTEAIQPPAIIQGPWAVMCDIDGTLADMKQGEPGRRGPYDWNRVGEDELKRETAFVLERMAFNGEAHTGIRIILVSGRDGVCRPETEEWLKKMGVDYDHLFMREAGDMRKDSIVKAEIYEREIKDKFNIEFVLDDRQQVVDMWRGLGLTCFQVAEGNF